MSYNQKVQIATLRGVDHLLVVESDLEVLLDEYQAGIEEVVLRDLFLSPWADDVIRHGLKAIAPAPAPAAAKVDPDSFAETSLVSANLGGLNFIACNEQQLEVVRDEIDSKLELRVEPVYTELACYRQLERGMLTLTGNKPWHHDLDSTIAMKVNSLLDGDISFGMDYGAATFVAFKTTMPHNQRVRDIMAIVPIGKACFPPVITTSWHDPFNTELDRLFETVEDASSTIEIGLQHLKVITALDALVQMEFIPWERQWPGIEI
jgi:hypothetical protein